MKPIRDYLLDMLQYVSDIESFTHADDMALFSDRKTQLAVMRAFEIIGEIAKRLPPDLLDAQPGVDWKAVKGFRDVLIHQYDNVDLILVSEAVDKLPGVRAAIEALLAGLPPEQGEDSPDPF